MSEEQHKGKPPTFCPECAFRGGVYDSRQKDEYLWRRHRCEAGHRWTSIEVMVANKSGQKNAAQQALKRMVLLEMIEKLKEQVPECPAASS